MELPKERILVWEELMLPENFDDIRAATMMFLKTSSQFPPTPGQLIDAADCLRTRRYVAAVEKERMERAAANQKADVVPGKSPEEMEEIRQGNLKVLRSWLNEYVSKRSIA